MRDYNNYNSIIALICISILITFYFIPFCIYGQDGYFIWFLIIGEYLHGNASYHASEVIFGGQNLGGIYGELPFWKIFRFFQPSIETFLNLTHAFFVIFFFLLSLSIINKLKQHKAIIDALVLLLYALFSPVIANRIMAGHLNLLYGTLPFFAFVSLIFNKSKFNIFLCVISVWCSLSTQAFQLLAYHIFYIPLLIHLVLKFENRLKLYFTIAFGIFLISFLLNYPNFQIMYRHAIDPNNLRTLDQKMVYSYITSIPLDLIQFFTTAFYQNLAIRNFGYFHEINYSVGAFIVFIFFLKKDKMLFINLALTFIVFYLFCMNVPGFNMLSELPLIKAFRVPQRIFMIPSLFLPLWCYVRSDLNFRIKDLSILLVLVFLTQFVSYFEFFALAGVSFILFNKKISNKTLALTLAFASLYVGFFDKVYPAYESEKQYLAVKLVLSELKQKFTADELRYNKFYFETLQAPLVNYVAQSLGISTVEGYGHPPISYLKKINEISGNKFPKIENSFYLPTRFPNRDKALKSFGVTKIVSFDQDNKMTVKDL